mmetsp:Transcript_58700/g.135319  ORF Transcript_58700/g.135319 Transcript_58700/m.135319 type:complete len:112 (-) Transcript_58700:1215-1550(-)
MDQLVQHQRVVTWKHELRDNNDDQQSKSTQNTFLTDTALPGASLSELAPEAATASRNLPVDSGGPSAALGQLLRVGNDVAAAIVRIKLKRRHACFGRTLRRADLLLQLLLM